MEQTNKIKKGLIVVLDWPQKNNKHYLGFDGQSVWPDSEWQSKESNESKVVTKICLSIGGGINSSLILENGLASIDELDRIPKYQQTLGKISRLLYLQFSDFTEVPSEVTQKFTFLGYDYGNYVSEYNYYSLIYHEIASNSKEKFKIYTGFLNENLLFPTLNITSYLKRTKTDLQIKGINLEDEQFNEEFQPIAIYSYENK